MIEKTCPIKPIPHADYFTQLSPAQFVMAVGEPETFRFSCNHSTIANIKLIGILRVSIPARCRISGTVLTLIPTHELHFDGRPVASLPMSPARLADLDMVEYAANGTVYSTSSGIPGPSLAEATRRWKDHLVSQDSHWSFWAKVQACIGVLFGMVLLILVLKCYFSYKQSQSHDLARQEMGELQETQLHLASQIVATQGQTKLAEERLAHRMQHHSLERRRRELARAATGPMSHSWPRRTVSKGGKKSPACECLSGVGLT